MLWQLSKKLHELDRRNKKFEAETEVARKRAKGQVANGTSSGQKANVVKKGTEGLSIANERHMMTIIAIICKSGMQAVLASLA